MIRYLFALAMLLSACGPTYRCDGDRMTASVPVGEEFGCGARPGRMWFAAGYALSSRLTPLAAEWTDGTTSHDSTRPWPVPAGKTVELRAGRSYRLTLLTGGDR